MRRGRRAGTAASALGVPGTAVTPARRSAIVIAPGRASTKSVLERVGDLATVFSELDHDLLLQPDIHAG
jgi:hypothetical protein